MDGDATAEGEQLRWRKDPPSSEAKRSGIGHIFNAQVLASAVMTPATSPHASPLVSASPKGRQGQRKQSGKAEFCERSRQ